MNYKFPLSFFLDDIFIICIYPGHDGLETKLNKFGLWRKHRSTYCLMGFFIKKYEEL